MGKMGRGGREREGEGELDYRLKREIKKEGGKRRKREESAKTENEKKRRKGGIKKGKEEREIKRREGEENLATRTRFGVIRLLPAFHIFFVS